MGVYGLVAARSCTATAQAAAQRARAPLPAAASCPFLSKRAICDSAATGVHVQAVARPPSLHPRQA